MVRAVVLREQGGVPAVEVIRLPEPGPGQVRVRLAAAGICHSDLSLANGTLAQTFPVVLGHEAAGVVASVGPGVYAVVAGDPVAIVWAPPCGSCWFCARGEPYLCENAMAGATVPYAETGDGQPLYAGLSTGAFAEETVVSERAVLPLPAGTSLDEAALLGCAVLTGVGAVRNTARVRPGDSVLVVGLGGVGLAAVQGARLAGADPVIAVDPVPERAGLARRLGATDVLEPGPQLGKQVRSLTGGRGADHAIECVGRGETIRAAWSATRRGGHTTVVGIGRRDDSVAFNALEVFHFARSLTGCVYGSCDPARDVPALLDDVSAGRLDLAGLATARTGLEGVAAALDAMARGDAAAGRTLVTP